MKRLYIGMGFLAVVLGGDGCARSHISREGALAMASDADAGLRICAANNLGRYADPESRRVLRVLAKDKEQLVRGSAIRSLGTVKDCAAVEIVLEALEADDGHWLESRGFVCTHTVWIPIWATAAESLEAITGHKAQVPVGEPFARRKALLIAWRSWLSSERGSK